MVPALQDGPVTVYHGDALDVLRQMPDESVYMVLTSPRYWSLRDYNEPGQLGLESTPDEYVANMVRLFREVRRVLRSDGTCWLNLGDSYASGEVGRHDRSDSWDGEFSRPKGTGARQQRRQRTGLKPKDLVMMPARVAMALQADGWYLRADIIWAKPNPTPESVTDRPTTSHEHVFLLTRSPRYFYDADAVREANVVAPSAHEPHVGEQKYVQGRRTLGTNGHNMGQLNPAGRNLRSVWQIATQPYSAAHFATFPEALCMAPIKAGTSERGCCPDCGAPWRRAVERMPVSASDGETTGRYSSDSGILSAASRGIGKSRQYYRSLGIEGPPAPQTTGWEPTCACGNETTVPCTVLDPFAGSGTTLAVARRLGRRAIGIELSQEYINKYIRKRVTASALPLLEFLQEAGG